MEALGVKAFGKDGPGYRGMSGSSATRCSIRHAARRCVELGGGARRVRRLAPGRGIAGRGDGRWLSWSSRFWTMARGDPSRGKRCSGAPKPPASRTGMACPTCRAGIPGPARAMQCGPLPARRGCGHRARNPRDIDRVSAVRQRGLQIRSGHAGAASGRADQPRRAWRSPMHAAFGAAARSWPMIRPLVAASLRTASPRRRSTTRAARPLPKSLRRIGGDCPADASCEGRLGCGGKSCARPAVAGDPADALPLVTAVGRSAQPRLGRCKLQLVTGMGLRRWRRCWRSGGSSWTIWCSALPRRRRADTGAFGYSRGRCCAAFSPRTSTTSRTSTRTGSFIPASCASAMPAARRQWCRGPADAARPPLREGRRASV